ncbi:hypothetical protein LCGC14_1048120 [marine sediment metagenome]|uniref:Uncharacterized protein n=1 Tax=marine sediment metagenome TaxID=412755 RepID=A0A0F9Q7W0_9ZZZZ
MLPSYIIKLNKIIFSKQTPDWCKLEYPNHKHGCPNYNKSDRCPPKAPFLYTVFDINYPLYLVHSEFNLTNHINKMKKKLPHWTDRQLRNVLYWQDTSRGQLRQRIEEAHMLLGTIHAETTPEAMGVNVYATAVLNGLHLDRIRHLKTCRHVAFVGTKLGDKSLELFDLL